MGPLVKEHKTCLSFGDLASLTESFSAGPYMKDEEYINMNVGTTGAIKIQPFPTKPASPLTGRRTTWAAIVRVIAPVMEVAQLVLPCLSAQPTAQRLSRETLHPASSPEWSAARRGGKCQPGCFCDWYNVDDGRASCAATGKWTSHFRGGEGAGPVERIFVFVSAGIRIAQL